MSGPLKADAFKALYLKPWGESKNKPPADKNFNCLARIDFTQDYGIEPGSALIVYVVGHKKIAGVFESTSEVQRRSEEELAVKPHMTRWPYYVVPKCLTPELAKHWHDAKNLNPWDLAESFHARFPDQPLTKAGGFGIKAIMAGTSALAITPAFAQFLFDAIEAEQSTLSKGDTGTCPT